MGLRLGDEVRIRVRRSRHPQRLHLLLQPSEGTDVTMKETNQIHRLVLVIVLLLTTLRCISSTTHRPPTSSDVVYFHIASACSSEKLSGVTVTVIDHDGRKVDVGQSREGGLAVIERRRLERARVILFCRDDHFCGSIENPRVPAGMEILVLLAPFAMT